MSVSRMAPGKTASLMMTRLLTHHCHLTLRNQPLSSDCAATRRDASDRSVTAN